VPERRDETLTREAPHDSKNKQYHNDQP